MRPLDVRLTQSPGVTADSDPSRRSSTSVRLRPGKSQALSVQTMNSALTENGQFGAFEETAAIWVASAVIGSTANKLDSPNSEPPTPGCVGCSGVVTTKSWPSSDSSARYASNSRGSSAPVESVMRKIDRQSG